MKPVDTAHTFDSAPAPRRRAPELLAPAGGPEPFAAALAAGADAIYCGMGDFNARRKAENFTDESFAAACHAAHLAGARVYVTVNIVIKDAELPRALEVVRHCTELGADAFIIQDWGLFFKIRELMPQVETHISTQANIHDARGAAWCRDAGADRVTLSRELSVAEIAKISKVGVDLEVFAHGSICFSYSGVCLLSSFACAGRSANRGMCAQPCRLPYQLVDGQGRDMAAPGRERPLCPRDTNTSEMLGELLDAGAHALKLEGRMKAPDYVYSVVDVYRRQLDDVLAGREVPAGEAAARARQLKRCFNRDFTCAYQRGESGDEMMSYERSNNCGQLVGEVLGSRTVGAGPGLARDDRRRKIARARIRLDEPVGAGDLLELRHDDEFDQFLAVPASADAAAGEVVELRVPRAMPAGSRVRVIRSQAAIEVAAAALKREVARRRAVDVRVRARLGEPFEVEVSCADDPALTGRATGFTVETARTRPVTREDLVEHVGRMGTTAFEPASFSVELDEGCGMGFSAVHKVRAAACEALERAILAPYRALAAAMARVEVPADLATAPDAPGAAAFAAELELCALAPTVELAELAREEGAGRVYVPTDALEAAGLSADEALVRGFIPHLDEVCRAADRARLDAWIVPGAPAAVGNISELARAVEVGAAAELRSCVPVHNAACAEALAARGAAGIWLSPEMTLDEVRALAPASPVPVGIAVMGRARVMTSEHCILQVADACIHDCARCRLRERDLWLKNIDGKLLPVRTDIHGRSRLYAAAPLDITPQMGKLAAAGVSRYLVDATLMDARELAEALGHARRALEAARAGRAPGRRLAGTEPGCLFVGVD